MLTAVLCFIDPYYSNLNIQTDPKGLVEIDGLSEVPISDFTKASWWYSKGRRVRSTSWTNVNEASSRSHWWVPGLLGFSNYFDELL